MRTVSYRLADLSRATIRIGRVGENDYTRVVFDSTAVFDEYPRAIPALTIAPPAGQPYPAVATREGDLVIWDVTDSDLVATGFGEAQLTFTEDGVVCKSCIAKLVVERSITATGEAPDPVVDWLAEANTALNAIPQTIDDALQEAKDSGEFDGDDGFSPSATVSKSGKTATITITDKDGTTTASVTDGEDGDDGFSPSASVSKSGKTATISITDKTGTTTATVSDGEDGDDGYSPSASVSKTGKTATITITDKTGTTTATVSDGEDGTDIIDDEAGSGDTDKTWSADKIAGEVSGLNSAIDGKADVSDIPTKVSDLVDDSGHYTKPASGIPASDLASGVIPSVPVTDVQVNGTSILSQGVANIPAASVGGFGVVQVLGDNGVTMNSSNVLFINRAVDTDIKGGTNNYKPIVPNYQHKSVFYGLASAAGDSTQSSSSNSVGTYTETAQSKISDMLNAPVSVSGTTPSITGKSGIRYVCGTVATLSITPPQTGCIDVVFTSGSTPTVLTVPNTVKFPAWFNPSSLTANTTYEINILDGTLGTVMAWA